MHYIRDKIDQIVKVRIKRLISNKEKLQDYLDNFFNNLNNL